MRHARIVAVVLLSVLGSSIPVDGLQQPKPADSKAIQDQLNRAASAILALKSAQFTVKREGTPALLDEKNQITFTTQTVSMLRRIECPATSRSRSRRAPSCS